LRKDHEIFHSPNKVELTYSNLPTPSSYRLYPEGADLPDTLPMWRVQTEGYKDENGMLVGTVSYNLSDAPDGEFISGGSNAKGPNSMAIGRQGSYLHWGFAASPTYMTDESKLVFINAIHYIHKHSGQRAFSKKKAVMRRDSIDSMLFKLSDSGNAAWSAMMEERAIEYRKTKKEILEKQKNGEELTKLEEAQLKWEEPSWKRTDALERLPETLRDKFGDDIDAYVEFFKTNRPWFYAEEGGWFEPLILDEDAKKIGIPNNEMRLLDTCIERLESDADDELAARLLRRYTTQSFDSAAEWKQWLTERREYLFFSEYAGFKYVLDVNRAIADGKLDWIPKPTPKAKSKTPEETAAAAIDNLSVDEPNGREPVKFKCALVPIESEDSTKDEKRFRVIVKFRILDGWHLYAKVPEGEPYIQTTMALEPVDGLKEMGEWYYSVPKPSMTNRKLMIWKNECVCSVDVSVTDESLLKKKLNLEIRHQACNETSCQRPMTKTIELTFPE